MIEILYYVIITILCLLLFYSFCKKRPLKDLALLGIVLVVFVLRAFHIK